MQTITIPSPIITNLSVNVPDVTLITRNDFQQQIYVNDFTACFTNTDEFAIEISYYHASIQTSETYAVNWDDPSTSLSMPDEMTVKDMRPQFIVGEAFLKHRIIKGDRCTKGGKTYFIEDFVKDGVGGVVVFLSAS